MRLVIPVPPEWQALDSQRWQIASAVTLEVQPLVELPLDLASWGVSVVRDVYDVRILGVRELATDLGWPFTLARSALASGEQRLHVLYRIEEYGGIAVVRASDAAALEACEREIVRVLASASAELEPRSEPALARLWA